MTRARSGGSKKPEKSTWIMPRDRLASSHGIDLSSQCAALIWPGAWLDEASGADETDTGNRYDLIAGPALRILARKQDTWDQLVVEMLHRLTASPPSQ